jgi:hypothetical protein
MKLPLKNVQVDRREKILFSKKCKFIERHMYNDVTTKREKHVMIYLQMQLKSAKVDGQCYRHVDHRFGCRKSFMDRR